MKIIVAASLGLLIILLFPYLMPVKNINCVSQYGECSENLKQDLSNLSGKSIKSTEINLKEYLSGNSKIEEFKVSFTPINKYSVQVIEDKSVVAIKALLNENFILVSEDNEKISESYESALPKLFISREEIAYNAPESKFASELLISLSKYYDINQVELDESSIVTRYKSDLEIIFPVSGDVDVLLGSLELLLFQLNQSVRDTKISSIDLRYKNPVVK